MPLLSKLALAWLLGIALAHEFNGPWLPLLILALPAAAALFLYRHNRRAKLIAALALALLAGAFRFTFLQPVIDESQVAFYNDNPQPLTLTGVVAAEPDVRDQHVNLQLQAEHLRQNGTARAVAGLVLVRAPRYPAFAYGDRLTISGKLETPPVFEDFSYREYLARRDIFSMVRRPHIKREESGQGNLFFAAMYSFKQRAAQTVNHILPEPSASLLNGILLGIRTGIPPALYEDFNTTGTSHVIVISGSNISIIAALLLLLGQKSVGRKYAPPLALAGIALYTLLVGADAAVMRAAFMGGLWVLALWMGRPGLALNALFFSALALTLLNPLILWDVGFQLSFMATLGLIVLVPPLERGTFALLKSRLKTEHVGTAMALLSELLIITVAAQIITGPLIIYHFGRLSLVSLLSNMLILPAQPFIMILGGLAVLAGLVWLPAGQAVGWLVWLPLIWTVKNVEMTVRWPLASVDLGHMPLWLLALAYAVLAAAVWWANQPRLQTNNRPHFQMPQPGAVTTRLWVGGVGITALLIWLAVFSLPDGRLHVAFLDVGQGDAALITLPDGRQILVDGGPSPTELNWRLGRQMPFWDRTLDLVINTHPELDHLGGLTPLPERFTIRQVLVTDVESTSNLFRQWQTELAAAGITPRIAQAGSQLALGPKLTAAVLNPGPASAAQPETNNHSVVLYLRYGSVSFLLPGDIEAPVEQALVQAGLPPVTALKAPHHGSKTSSSVPFLDAVNPQVVVISVGADNRFGHPSPEITARYAKIGAQIFRTDELGTVELTTDGRHLWVETARQTN